MLLGKFSDETGTSRPSQEPYLSQVIDDFAESRI